MDFTKIMAAVKNAVVRSEQDLQKFVSQVVSKLGDNLSDKPWTVSIRRFYRIRTLNQNAKFHAMIHDIAEHIGYERPDDIKDYVKSEFGWKKTVKIGSNIADIPMSTTEYNIEQFGFMIDRLYQLGAELGVEWKNATDDSPAG